ncbi:hypothetical protein CMI37_29545 [Candidatus Pacearchaeota archaeon]|nr:hypothetical protein [Candidatus Pacearchaeota archaeon]|tara:strand:- start:789 stop:1049 length:261 start_codon:yes stop_codon:yes gene_type:complete
MDSDEHSDDYNFEIGDIVRESVLIIPPDREPWTGIVVYIDKDFYELHSFLGQTESLIAVHWFKAGYVETLPASVLRMIQKAKEKDK